MSDTNNTDKKKYNPTLGRAYEMKNGYWSVPLDAADYDTIMKSVEIGGRLVLKINKRKLNDKSPDAYFEFVPLEQVKEMEANRQARFSTNRDSTSEDI